MEAAPRRREERKKLKIGTGDAKRDKGLSPTEEANIR
jgi:hypothetical protein